MKKVKIIMRGSPGGMSEEDNDQNPPKKLMVEKIENGFVIKRLGFVDDENAQFVKNLAESPTIIARMMKVKGKSPEEIRGKYKSEVK